MNEPANDQRRSRWPAAVALVVAMGLAGGCSMFSGSDSATLIRAEYPSGSDSQVRAESKKLSDRGLSQHRQGNIVKAAELFESALVSDPSNGVAHNNLGLVRYQQRRLANAAEHYQAAANLLPENPVPLNNLGMALEAGGRLDEAADLYRQAVDLSANRPTYLGNLVRVKYRLGDRDELLRMQMEQLLFMETRPVWRAWLEERLQLELSPFLDRGGMEDSPFGGIPIRFPTTMATGP